MVANYQDEEDLRRERERHIVEEGRSAEMFLSEIYLSYWLTLAELYG